ncbi:hypothetical protein F8388_000497 [Cannabis sativa]|uniref:Terpene synthase metal-binding domain-containing protein n=1 Tax=Cannabis sativa TaxID=3483 RepID=A0A7J6HGR3_CANSA|nr:hypothetical protein F8388_000497 [Cannabis sativa]KAF4394091.1 hypothetical protein G4B88_026060 [Cannabis sativa]
MKDSLITELENFTKAIQRWDGEGLSGVSKKIFDALDNFWYETIVSWLTESKWSKSGIIPTMDEYFKVGMTSIATHTLLLPASYFLKPSLKISQLQSTEYAIVTKLVMIICRLLNDIQSYETTTLFKQDIECKEKNEGKPNSITVYLKNNPEVEIEEAIEVGGGRTFFWAGIGVVVVGWVASIIITLSLLVGGARGGILKRVLLEENTMSSK